MIMLIIWQSSGIISKKCNLFDSFTYNIETKAMREITFEVTLRFSSKVTADEEILEVQQNILDAIVRQAESAILAPLDSDAFTTNIKVFEPLTQVAVSHTF